MYNTYILSFACGDTLKFIEVVANSLDAAMADVQEAYVGLECVSVSVK